MKTYFMSDYETIWLFLIVKKAILVRSRSQQFKWLCLVECGDKLFHQVSIHPSFEEFYFPIKLWPGGILERILHTGQPFIFSEAPMIVIEKQDSELIIRKRSGSVDEIEEILVTLRRSME